MYNSTHLKKLGATKVSWVLPLVKLLVDWRLSDLPGLMPPREVSEQKKPTSLLQPPAKNGNGDDG